MKSAEKKYWRKMTMPFDNTRKKCDENEAKFLIAGRRRRQMSSVIWPLLLK